MKRILIVGRPGSGKTTLAKQLAQQYNLPVIHLDSLYFDPTNPYHGDPAEWQKKLTEITTNDQWIIEGLHVIDMANQTGRAEQVFFMDVPVWEAAYRIIKRSIILRKRVPDEMPEGWKQLKTSNAAVWWWRCVIKFKKTFKLQLDELFANSQEVIIKK